MTSKMYVVNIKNPDYNSIIAPAAPGLPQQRDYRLRVNTEVLADEAGVAAGFLNFKKDGKLCASYGKGEWFSFKTVEEE